MVDIDFDENKYTKKKLRTTFNDLEVYNPQAMKDIYKELCELIKENSRQVELEDGLFDIQIDNIVKIMRFMFIELTNLDITFLSSSTDAQLEEKFNTADGDFKEAIDSLLDIIVEVAQDIRKENVRKLKLVENKIIELAETFKFNNNINEKLKEFGIDMNTITAIQNLLEQSSEQENENLIENK